MAECLRYKEAGYLTISENVSKKCAIMCLDIF